MWSKLKKVKKARRNHRRKIVAAIVLFVISTVLFSLGLVWFGLVSRDTLLVSPVPVGKQIIGKNIVEQSVVSKIEGELKRQKISYTMVTRLDSTSYTILLQDQAEVLVSTNKDIILQISSLQVIYSRLTMEGKRFKKLDLRFVKPVIVLM